MLITPAEFEDEMKKIEDSISNQETRFNAACDLMCDVLDSLGYGIGVQMFKAMRTRE